MRLACLLLVMASTPALFAAPPQPAPAPSPSIGEPSRISREHFARGRELYLRGRFDDASSEFELGYRSQQLPLFLYNIAQSARRAGRIDKAIDFYQRYLAASPEAPERAEVRRTLDELQRERSATAPPPTTIIVREPASPALAPAIAPSALAPTDGAVVVAATPRKHSRRNLWIAIGVGAAAVVAASLATGLALGLPRDPPSSELGNHRVFFPTP